MPIDAAKALAAAPAWEPSAGTTRTSSSTTSASAAKPPATDPDELRYTLESKLHVLPSFATVAGAGMAMLGGLAAPGIEVNLAAVLHGGHSIELHRPIPVKGEATSTSKVAAVYDKGKAAVIVLRSEVADADGPLWTSDAQLFVRGEGGFGGERGPSVSSEQPGRAPDRTEERRIREDQALLYRLSGDWNPCTPTRSSPSWPASTSRSCTACARTA